MAHLRNAGSVAAVSVLLAACGGGGGEDETAATGDLTPANYLSVSGESVEQVVRGMGSETMLRNAMPLSVAGAGTGVVLEFGWLQQQLVERMSGRSTRERAAAVSTDILPCSSGHLSLSATYAREDDLTRGDKIQISSVNCVQDGQAVTGTIEATLLDVIETSSRLYMKLGMRASAFGSSSYRVDGPVTVTVEILGDLGTATPVLRMQTFGFNFSGFSITSGSPAKTWTLHHGYQLVDNRTVPSYTMSLSGVIEVDGQRYRLEQQTPFSLPSTGGFPQGGVVHMKDKEGDRAVLTATPTRFTYAFQPAGSNAPTQGPVDGPLYSSLLGGSGSVGGGSTQPASGN